MILRICSPDAKLILRPILFPDSSVLYEDVMSPFSPVHIKDDNLTIRNN